jgi:enoyl-CoA hydratase/carnithine racemase
MCLLWLFSVNKVVPTSAVLSTALAVAKELVANSPDAVQSTKEALLLSQTHNFRDTFLAHVKSSVSTRVYKGDNIKVWIFS